MTTRAARGWTFAAICGLLPAALAVALVAAPLLSWAHLPASVAVHWSLGGQPDRASSKSAAFLYAAAYGCLGAVVMWKLVWRRGDAPARPAGAVGLGLLLLAGGASRSLVVTLANAGTRSWMHAPFGITGQVAGIAGPVVLAVIGELVMRRASGVGTTAGGDLEPAVQLGIGAAESALWVGRARSRWALPAAAACIAAGVVAATSGIGWEVGTPLLLAGLFFLQFTSVRVIVSITGVKVAYGTFGWPRTWIALRRIERADAVDVVPLSFWRFSPTTVVLRKGPALSLALGGGGTRFLVTVDDAPTGAGLVNDMLARSRTTQP